MCSWGKCKSLIDVKQIHCFIRASIAAWTLIEGSIHYTILIRFQHRTVTIFHLLQYWSWLPRKKPPDPQMKSWYIRWIYRCIYLFFYAQVVPANVFRNLFFISLSHQCWENDRTLPLTETSTWKVILLEVEVFSRFCKIIRDEW